MIVGATGHQAIPELALAEVGGMIEEALKRHSDFTGVCSLAAGADQVFASIVLRLGGKLHVIVPCENYQQAFSSEPARKQFNVMLAKASCVETLPHPGPSEVAFLEAGQRVVDLSDEVIAIWDGQRVRGTGGTADIVQYALEAGREVIVLWPPNVVR